MYRPEAPFAHELLEVVHALQLIEGPPRDVVRLFRVATTVRISYEESHLDFVYLQNRNATERIPSVKDLLAYRLVFVPEDLRHL